MTRPQVHQHVTVRIGERDRVPARVEQTGPGELTLALFTELAAPLDAGTVTVEFTDRCGVHRFPGAVEPDGSGRDVLALRIAGDPQHVQRREFARVDAVVPVRLALGGEGAEVATFTLNLSGGGVLLAGPAHLDRGEVVWLELRLPDDRPRLEVAGTVVRETPEGHKGVYLERIAPRDRELLIRFVFDRERLARRLTRDG